MEAKCEVIVIILIDKSGYYLQGVGAVSPIVIEFCPAFCWKNKGTKGFW